MENYVKYGAQHSVGSSDKRSGKKSSYRYEQSQLGGDNPYVNLSARLYTNPWEKEVVFQGKKPLYKSFVGRAATRLFSRGVMGAAFMAAGELMLQRWDPFIPLHEQGLAQRQFTRIAKFIDTTVTNPTVKIAGLAGKAEEVERYFNTFRVTRPFSSALKEGTYASTSDVLTKLKHGLTGRTYGQEVVGMTAGFAMGSIGDALGRNIVATLDPNHRLGWRKENGKFNFKEIASNMARSAWGIMSYNQAEDWFSGLFYVHQMRLQRKLLTSLYGENTGINFNLDHQANGGSFILNDKGDITGSLMNAGAMDLQLRFMGYNWYTLMYRDIYNHLSHVYSNWKENGYQLPAVNLPKNPVSSVGHATSETTKYIGKSFIKSMLYMLPAVPFFWSFRTPFSRENAFFVHPEGILHNPDPAGKNIFKTSAQSTNGWLLTNDIKDYASTEIAYKVPVKKTFVKRQQSGPLNLSLRSDELKWFKKDFSPHDPEYAVSRFDKALNPFGQLMHGAREETETLFAKALEQPRIAKSRFGQFVSRKYGSDAPKQFATAYVNSAIPYYFYMMAKYETENHINSPVFDAAAYRFIDGVSGAKWNDVKEGASDMWNIVFRRPVSQKTLEDTNKPRGLVNSMHEAKQSSDTRQQAFREEAIQKKLAENNMASPGNKITNAQADTRVEEEKNIAQDKKVSHLQNGWGDYEMARAHGQHQRKAPEGVTIH